MFDNAQAKATVNQGPNFPDFFSCLNCEGSKTIEYCRELREANLCAKAMLRDALKAGSVQVVLYLPGGVTK